MSDTKGSTFNHEEELQRFERNPVGYTVELDDGTQAVVGGFRDTPRGRWYRLRRRGGPWVPAHAVVGFMVYSVGLRRPEAPTGALA